MRKFNDSNPAWKGENASNTTIHEWVRNNFENTKKCEHCGRTDIKLDWSNKDHKHRRIRSDWQLLCKSCHMKYDIKHNNRFVGKRRKFEWSHSYEHCIECGKKDSKYCAHGLCFRCYLRKRKEMKHETV